MTTLHWKKLLVPGVVFLFGVTISLPSDAQRTRFRKPVLHTYIKPPTQGGNSRGTDPNGKGLGVPKSPASSSTRPNAGEPTYDDQFSGRQNKVKPDTETTHEGDMVYHAAFNPTVAPMKRTSAMDKVDRKLELSVANTHKRAVPLMDTSLVLERDFFWGSFLVDNVENRAIPIPSVSPDMLPHRYKTTPNGFDVSFSKDGADNFSLKLKKKIGFSRRGRSLKKVRVQVLVSGKKSYFGGPLPEGMSLKSLRGNHPQIPRSVVEKAKRVIRKTGVSASDSLARKLHKLVAYFRAFKEGPCSKKTGVVYLDLSLSQKGVCRHRSYAFVITAQALGIPARYVSNELHVFVEVLLPRVGWRRIDLGGATPQMEIIHEKNHRKHRPPPDPFPKSSSSNDNGSPNPLDSRQNQKPGNKTKAPPGSASNPLDYRKQGANPGSWITAKALGLLKNKLNSPGKQGPPYHKGVNPSSRSNGKSSSGSSNTQQWPKLLPGLFNNAKTAPEPISQKITLSPLSIKSSGLRGTPFHARGLVQHQGRGVGGHRVVVVLHPPNSKSAVVVGEAITDLEGRYDLEALVPKEIPVGLYKIYAHSPKQGRYKKATTQ